MSERAELVTKLVREGPVSSSEFDRLHTFDWGLELSGYVGGPFEDHTGGLITFDADEVAQGTPWREILSSSEGLPADHWLKRWAPE